MTGFDNESFADNFEALLRAVGYIPRRPDIKSIEAALKMDLESAGGSRTILLMGPPGTGKSRLPSAVAQVINATFLSYQFHAWTDDSELFTGVDVCAAVAGDSESVRQDGILAMVARASQSGTVVLLLDEIDKTQERTEVLLLDWLEYGRVPIKPGVHLQTKLENVITFITSNEHRELCEATKRRAARVMMNPLPVKQQEALIQAQTGLPGPVVRTVWKAARSVSEYENNPSLSVQEGIKLALSVWNCAESAVDLKIYLSQWAARSSKGRGWIASGDRKLERNVNATWSELCRARKRFEHGA